MSQAAIGTINPATESGSALATRLTNFGAADLTMHSGSSRPSYAVAGTFWLDTTTTAAWALKLYDGTSDVTVATVNSSTHAKVDGAATQAQQETGTDTTAYVTPGRQHFHRGHPKFWASVSVAGGTPTLVSSYNVSGISDTGTGQLTISFDDNFSSNNWTCIVNVFPGAVSTDANLIVGFASSLSTGSVVCNSRRVSDGALADPGVWYVVGYGDQ